MGKRNFRGGKGGGGKRQKGGKGGTGWDARAQWPEPVKESPALEFFYKAQNTVPEGEWDDFMKACRAVLPTTFRISPVGTFAGEVKDQLKSRFSELQIPDNTLTEDDERLLPPKPMDWYPDNLAWYMSISKKALKRTPALERFHKYLVAETETGNLTRQEAVSMIPPLFMDIEPHHRILDMCAAPGSKTSQCLEYLHMAAGANGVPEGIVMANDADLDRCGMLIHQMKRINSPSLVVLHHEAQKIPMLWSRSEDGSERRPLRYDRVLADVPCSGDGTMRKNCDVWKKWTPAMGMGLHRTQIQILSRAVELTEAGGVVVYSTCSMNPMENESVVAWVLKKFSHCLRIEDVSEQLPALKRCPGLLTWKVQDKKEEKFWENPAAVPDALKQMYPLSMFPPDDAAEMHLERCVRVLPHHQDTGAFFITKLRKFADHNPPKAKPEGDAAPAAAKPADAAPAAAGDVKTEGKTEEGAPACSAEKVAEPKRSQKKSKYEILMPIKDKGLIDRLVEFYGIKDTFPLSQLFSSSETTSNKIYFVAAAVKEMLAADGKGQMHTVHAGVKMFEKNPTKNETFDYRLRQEGVPFLLPYMTKRVLKVGLEDFKTLIGKRALPMTDLKTPSAKAECAAMASGCVLFLLDSPEYQGTRSVFMAGWRGTAQLTLFVSKMEIQALSHKFKVDPVPDPKKEAPEAKAGEAAEEESAEGANPEPTAPAEPAA